MVNNIKNISKIIYLLDKHILEILMKDEVDVEILDSLTTTRIEFLHELNNLIRTKNTSDMFDKKYFEHVGKSN